MYVLVQQAALRDRAEEVDELDEFAKVISIGELHMLCM